MGIKLNTHSASTPDTSAYGQSRRVGPKLRWYSLVLLISLPMLYLLYQLLQLYVFIKFPGFIQFDKIVIRSPANGYIRKLYVAEGQGVKVGMHLIDFTSPEVEFKLKYLREELNRIEAHMTMLSQESDQSLQDAIVQAEKEITATNETYTRFQAFRKSGVVDELKLEEARKNWVQSVQYVQQLKQLLEKNQADKRHNMEVFFRRRVAEIKSEIALNEALLNEYQITSTKNGRIIDLTTFDGEYVPAGQNLMTIATDEHLRIAAYVEPQFIELAHKGRQVSIYLSNNQKIKGVIMDMPSLAARLPAASANPVATRSNKIIILIKPIEPIAPDLAVYGAPVKVALW